MSNPLIKQIRVDNVLYDIYDEAAHTDITTLNTQVTELGNTLAPLPTKVAKSEKYCLDFDNSAISKSGFSKVSNNYFEMNGTSGVNYNYIKIGRLVIAKFTVHCIAGTHHNWIKVASGLPAPCVVSGKSCSDTVFALGCESNPSDGRKVSSLAGSLRTGGDVYFSGGTAGCYYYGQCIYYT